MTRESAAIAVFVKTPGLSPIKTRLAAGIGAERSAEFYRLSVAAVAATVAAIAKSSGATPYWAVAEEAGLDDPLWQKFACISQGTGDLGNRLNHVFDALQMQHTAVIAIGADSPQITPPMLESTLEILLDRRGLYPHVLGRSLDGGFYLVGSNARLPQETWLDVPYSTPTTAKEMAASLHSSGQIKELARITDVDQAENLPTLKKELLAIGSPTPEQLTLLNWLNQTIIA